jgi:hypothetical protein
MGFPFIGLKSSTKNEVFLILSETPSLNAKEIHKKLVEKGSRQTYQATHKTLKELEREKVIEKREKNYSIKIEWITQIKKLGVPKNSKKKIEFNKNTATLKFSTAMEIAEFVMKDLCNLPNPNKKIMIVFHYLMWPPICLSENDFINFKKIVKENKIHGICFSQTLLDKTSAQTYIQNGAKIVFNHQRPMGEDKIVFSDYIAEIYFDKEIYTKWEKLYKNTKKLDGEKINKLFLLTFTKKGNNLVQVTKSPELADQIRKDYLPLFKEPKK